MHPLVELLTTSFTLVGDRLQLRDGRLHDLHDDLRRDVRVDTQGRDGQAAQRTA